ncbi:cryptochrome/photolyase family protein [Candidatus Fokinia crypta]|uniref:Deoxyribodipyrimidine photolyase N-terminal domain protein n=1 Tax=Candidatus Fokinia crypta TaxID=1920990 RepID=A0ABZ0UPR9_9RICK|nr:cryptochrome/photolyase family protein [Candidatus Fokinia cryptica]WPX97887.1 Putative deoxyribodipyrimidine photolyase N-terminal domain protein [Candidatus Fokinia cryptica]
MKNLCFIFSDQLSHSIPSLADVEENDIIFLCEVMEEATYVKHHPKKIAFLFASMRYFAAELELSGHRVHYTKLTNSSNTNTLSSEIIRIVQTFAIEQRIIFTESSEYRMKVMIEELRKLLKIPIQVRTDNRFLCSIQEFKLWTQGKKQLRMEYFYCEMRKKYQILMKSKDFPIGGKWNYDKENRKPPIKNLTSPRRISHKKIYYPERSITNGTRKIFFSFWYFRALSLRCNT